MFEELTQPKKGFRLESAVTLNKTNPDTFLIPSRKDRESLEVGDLVKLNFISLDSQWRERMLVEVSGVQSKKYEGLLRSCPTTPELEDSLQWGDVLEFEPRHIIKIMKLKKNV